MDPSPAIRLHVVPPHGAPFERLFDGESLIIGRSEGADLEILDPFLSRQHSRLFRREGRVFVEDLGSRNGTLLNGQPVREPQPVQPGDVIRISSSVISIHEAGRVGEPEHSSALGQTVLRRASDLLAEQRDASSSGNVLTLRRAADRLHLLNEVHQALGRPLALGELLELILDRVFDHLRPERGAIFLRRPDGALERVAARSRAGPADEVVLSRNLAREVADKGMAALVLDVLTDERFAAAESLLASGIRSLLAAPLLTPDGVLGLILLDSRAAVREFHEDDMELLVGLASAAALRIRNLALAEEVLESRRLEEELQLARRIQVALLPARLPELAGYDLHGGNVPSRGVSGDFYEVVERRGGAEVVLLVADVSGKGMAASLLTATLEALAASPIEDGLPPEEICARLSRLLHRRTPPEKYATVFLAVLEPASGRLSCANAGHNPALVVRARGGVETLGATGVPIGLLPAAAYGATETRLYPGDLLVLYTDGITEAVDAAGEEYGLDRLSALCAARRKEGAAQLAAALEADLLTFTAGVPFADDRTLVLLRRLAG